MSETSAATVPSMVTMPSGLRVIPETGLMRAESDSTLSLVLNWSTMAFDERTDLKNLFISDSRKVGVTLRRVGLCYAVRQKIMRCNPGDDAGSIRCMTCAWHVHHRKFSYDALSTSLLSSRPHGVITRNGDNWEDSSCDAPSLYWLLVPYWRP